MSEYTLVSFIGRNYEMVNYHLPENDEVIKANIASLALISSKKQHWNIDQAVIIGTHTSNWAELVAYGDNDELYNELSAICVKDFDNDPIKAERFDKAIDKLGDYLKDKYKISFILIAHRQDLLDSTVDEIISDYDDVYDYVEDSQNLLIDITHGYRHMPVLLFQTFQQHLIQLEGKDVELVYAEREDIKDPQGAIVEKRSVFRDLRKYWTVARRSDAINRFVTTFDGDSLVGFLNDEGLDKAAGWMRMFTNIVKANFIMQIRQVVRSLPSVIISLESKTDDLTWIKRLKKELEEMNGRFSQCHYLYDYYIVFAQLFDERKMLTQAIIAIDAAIETRMVIFEARKDCMENEEVYVGDYDYWRGTNKQNCAKTRLRAMLGYDKKIQHMFDRFYSKKRNLIAHGGGEAWKNIISDTFFEIGNCFHLAQTVFDVIDEEEKRYGIDVEETVTLADYLPKSSNSCE